jgi:hypothetical protein
VNRLCLLLCASACAPADPDRSADAAPVALSCSAPQECPSFACSCVDGAASNVFARCEDGACGADGDAGCDELCAEHGGVDRVATDPNPHVGDSEECRAWCRFFLDETAGLACAPDVCALSDCEIPDGSCAMATKAFLACLVEGGTEFTCYDDETLEVASSCEQPAC